MFAVASGGHYQVLDDTEMRSTMRMALSVQRNDGGIFFMKLAFSLSYSYASLK